MKNILKGFFSLILIFSLCFSLSTKTFASSDTNEKTTTLNDNIKEIATSNSLKEINSKFASMSNDELNDYIDYVMNSTETNSSNSSSTTVATISSVSLSSVQLAWLAAAQIAEDKGYTCAAELVRCSVNDTEYYESAINANGLFSKKIVSTSVFKSYISKVKAGSSSIPDSLTFTKSINSDLFYALHNVDITYSEISSMYSIEISDVFDFAYDNDYDSLFTSAVNNWAWLCQQTDVLNDIDVTILFFQ